MAGEFLDLVQIVQERGDLLQIQVLRVAERPGAQLTAELGIGSQAVFEDFVALAGAGAHLR
ncbi:hypothetical protein D3C87_2058640 [compost metagenome]